MYFVGLMVSFLWGIGQNLPYDKIYWYGIGPGDFVFLYYLALAAVVPAMHRPLLRSLTTLRIYLYLVVVFVGLTLLSSFINAPTWGIEGNDVIEIFRPLYYFLIVVFVAAWIARYGLSKLLVAFLCGILLSGFIAFVNPVWEDYAGFNVLWNPNVIGNILAIGLVLASLLILDNRFASAAFFIVPLLVLTLFTFSKGTWLMALLALSACLTAAISVARNSKRRFVGKSIFAAAIVSIAAAGALYFDIIYDLVSFKLQTTQFDYSASEGGTVAARAGFVVASLHLGFENPLTGVGISNYERAYDSLRDKLGENFWETDNPHSAWLYVIACIGFPAFAVFMLIVLYPLWQLWRQICLPPFRKKIYIFCVSAVFFLSGAVLLHLLTQYYLWVFTGMVIGWGNYKRSRLDAARLRVSEFAVAR